MSALDVRGFAPPGVDDPLRDFLATYFDHDDDATRGMVLDYLDRIIARAALSGEAPDRDGEIARIAAVIEAAEVEWSAFVLAGPSLHLPHGDYIAARLYDAGLRAHPEAGERCPTCGDDTPDEACGDKWHWGRHLAPSLEGARPNGDTDAREG